MSQHYGGITFTPYAVENYGKWGDGYRNKFFLGPKTTFGYAVGYQGLLLPARRFSITYGLQYSSMYTEISYNEPRNMYHNDISSGTKALGERRDFVNIELPIWLRYNILKGTRKFQPFIGVCYNIAFKIKYQDTFYLDDHTEFVRDYGKSVYSLVDVGVGLNYRPNDKWIMTTQATYSYNIARKIGLGISVMRKF
jgi:hypothetical protein